MSHSIVLYKYGLNLEIPIDFNINTLKYVKNLVETNFYSYRVDIYQDKRGSSFITKSCLIGDTDEIFDCHGSNFLIREYLNNKEFEQFISIPEVDSLRYDVNTQRLYLFINYVEESEDLMCFVERDIKFDYTKTRSLALWLFRSLLNIHKNGYYHMDIKLENILYNNKNFYMIDFASCRKPEELETVHLKFGTPDYMSPLKFDMLKNYQNRGTIYNRNQLSRVLRQNDIFTSLAVIYSMYTLEPHNDFRLMYNKYPFFYNLFSKYESLNIEKIINIFLNWQE